MTHVVIKGSCFVSLFSFWLTFKTWLCLLFLAILVGLVDAVTPTNKIDGAGDLLTQGSIASGGPLTQGSVASGCNETVHKVEPFSSLG